MSPFFAYSESDMEASTIEVAVMKLMDAITLLDSQTLSVVPWEKNMIGSIEKAILESNIGLNPSSVGDLIRIPMPPLSQERRRELIKIVKGFAEDSKVSIRNVRREANDASKKKLKVKEISSDDDKRFQDEISGG